MYEAKKAPSRLEVTAELRRLAAEQGVLAPRRPEWQAGEAWRCKSPAVVVRLDGLYGVAVLRRGYQHAPQTYSSRLEAERAAWALARELGSVEDWP